MQYNEKPLWQAIYLPFFAFAFTARSYWSILPSLLESTIGVKASGIGLALALQGAGSVLMLYPGSAVNQLVGFKLGASLPLILFATAMLMFGVSTSRTAFFLGFVMIGVGRSWYLLSIHTYLTVKIRNNHRGRSLGTLGTIRSIAGVVGPLSLSSFALLHGERWTCIAMGILLLISCAGHVRFLPRPNTGRSGSRSRGCCTSCVKNPTVLLRFLPFISFVKILRYGMDMLIPLLCITQGLSAQNVSILMAIQSFVTGFTVPIGGYVMDKWSPRRNAKAGTILITSGFFFVFWLYGGGTRPKFLLLIICVSIFGLGDGMLQGIFVCISGSMVEPSKRGSFLSLVKTCSEVCGICTAVIFGKAVDMFSLPYACLGLAFVGIASFVWVHFFILAHTKNRDTAIDGSPRNKKSDEENFSLLPNRLVLNRSLSYDRGLEKLSDTETLIVEDAARVDESDDEFSIQLTAPFFDIESSTLDAERFNQYRRDYARYRNGASQGAEGEAVADRFDSSSSRTSA